MKKLKTIISGIIISVIIVIAAIQIYSYSEEPIRNDLDTEWQVSGKFQIDKSEYMLGEKVFINIVDLDEEQKGYMQVLRPVNDTFYQKHLNIHFDGSKKSSSNLYFAPQLDANKKICSPDELLGTWLIKLKGTEYQDLKFIITDEILLGIEYQFEPIC